VFRRRSGALPINLDVDRIYNLFRLVLLEEGQMRTVYNPGERRGVERTGSLAPPLQLGGVLKVVMRLISQILSSFASPLALSVALVFGAFNCAAPQAASGATDGIPQGIRHALYVTVKSDPASAFLPLDTDAPYTATLGVKTRISAHSQETNFSGDVLTEVADFDPIRGSKEQEVWKDAKCHHERGFPKITVIEVDGLIKNGQRTIQIDARFRQIGLRLPADEVMPSRRIATGTDDFGLFVETRTETKQSRLVADLKLYILPCDLTIKNTGADADQK